MVDYKCTTPSSTTLPFEEPTFESNEMYHIFHQSNQNPTESFLFSSTTFTLEDLFEPYQQQTQINAYTLHDQGFGDGSSRGSGSVESGSGAVYRCQAEGCKADLTHCKNYHKRHKVCELHSKAPTVLIAGLTKRFCQQCSRFHLLSEFDKEKRSCRKRLIEHNRRRRMMGMKP